jgi:hypothetical protein
MQVKSGPQMNKTVRTKVNGKSAKVRFAVSIGGWALKNRRIKRMLQEGFAVQEIIKVEGSIPLLTWTDYLTTCDMREMRERQAEMRKIVL